MALLQRRTDERETTVDDDVATERAGASPGIVRALFTLAGVAGAGLLLWLAQLFTLDETSGFWIGAAIVAAAGVALGLSQLFGGWTKWGWPVMSPMMLLFAFVPTLLVGGTMMLSWQPEGAWGQEGANDIISSLGAGGLVDALAPFMWIVPLVIGLVFSFTFDTTGPRIMNGDLDTVRRERVETTDRDRTAVPDEDVHDYRRDDETVAAELRDRDKDGVVEPAGTARTDTRADRDRI